MACFERIGHRITCDRRLGRFAEAGDEKVHATIDYATRLAYVEVFHDEKQNITFGFLLRAVAWFNSRGNHMQPGTLGKRA